jgi:drug/metabolite transporter (DMT)-like permease
MSRQNFKNFSSVILNKGPLLIVMAAILWGVDGVIRRSLLTLPPIIIVFYEHLLGAAILSLVAWPSLLKLKLTKKIVGLTLAISILSGLLGTLWFTSALVKVNFIAFSVVFLLQKLQPIFAVTAARIFLKEKITKQYLWWAGLALVAAYFVTFPSGSVNLSTGTGTVVAALLALGAAAAWGISTVFSKMLLAETTHTQATALRFFTTTIMALVAVVVMGQASMILTPDLTQVFRFGFIAVSTGMVALWIYYKGLKQTQAKISTILELVFPFLAVTIDAFLYKTVLAPTQYLAAAVLLFAIYRVGKLQNSSLN